MMLSKNVNNKRCAPKLIFFNEKKIEKDSDNFWYRKLTLKIKRLGDFALFGTSPLTQFSKFYKILWVCCFLILYPPFENFTTRIAMVNTLSANKKKGEYLYIFNSGITYLPKYCTPNFTCYDLGKSRLLLIIHDLTTAKITLRDCPA